MIRTATFSVRVVAIAAAFGVSACGLPQKINDSAKVDYKSVNQKTNSVNLEVPPDLANPQTTERYSVPEGVNAADQRTLSTYERNAGTNRPVIATPAQQVLPAGKGVKVERNGNTRWLVVERRPEQLWPILREFWQEAGFTIDRDDPINGILETDWAENRAKLPKDFIRNALGKVIDSLYDTGTRDRFRTRLEAGANGSTEIYISHRGLVEVVSSTLGDSTVWQPRPNDPDLEAEFLQRMLVKLGTDADQSKAMVVNAKPLPSTASAQGVGRVSEDPSSSAPYGQAGLQLINDSASPRIEIREGFDRAWRRVGLALDRGSFTVEDRDRSQGIYYVRYIDPELEARNSNKPGFFSKLFSKNSSRKDSAASRQYRIRVTGKDSDASSVSVLNRDGQQVTAEADRATVTRILVLLNDQLRQ